MTHTPVARPILERYHHLFRDELSEHVMPFWMKHSPDRECGGYFNCLDRDGAVYDTKKHVWLQGRQVWMLAKLHNAHHGPGESSQWLEAATLGADFIRRHARDGRRVYFALTREGKPAFLQRKMFSECFYVMAMAEYARASGDTSAREEALDLFAAVQEYARDPSLLGRPAYDHLPPTSELAVPMILLNLIEELKEEPTDETFAELAEWCVQRIHLHIRPELNLVLETVGVDGRVLDSPEGRLVNPGHAIEAGWFLLDYARKRGDDTLVRTALNMIDWSYDFGWDERHGGLFYFLDREGYSPIQLEWNMKLWWPHCEALVAFLMAYAATGETRWFHKFTHTADYTFQRFSDHDHGEWYGYLDRHGEVSQRFKGGPYKGCFHVPRALFLCESMLRSFVEEAETH